MRPVITLSLIKFDRIAQCFRKEEGMKEGKDAVILIILMLILPEML
jgi:hypothetical protein